jgi:hypothetical protein
MGFNWDSMGMNVNVIGQSNMLGWKIHDIQMRGESSIAMCDFQRVSILGIKQKQKKSSFPLNSLYCLPLMSFNRVFYYTHW